MTDTLKTPKLFIGNLPWTLDDEGLADVFSAYGTVVEAFVMKDRETGRSKGFGFVSFSTVEEAESAVNGLNGKDVQGREINVDFAKPKSDKPREFRPRY